MEILIYRNDEEEALTFDNVREAIDYMKLRAINEDRDLSDYVIKVCE